VRVWTQPVLRVGALRQSQPGVLEAGDELSPALFKAGSMDIDRPGGGGRTVALNPIEMHADMRRFGGSVCQRNRLPERGAGLRGATKLRK